MHHRHHRPAHRPHHRHLGHRRLAQRGRLHRPSRRHRQGPRLRRDHRGHHRRRRRPRVAPRSPPCSTRARSTPATPTATATCKSADFFDVETYPTWTFISTVGRAEGRRLRPRRRPHHPRRHAARRARDRVQRHRDRPVRQRARRLLGHAPRSPARTSASPGTPPSRPVASWWRQGHHRARRLRHQGLTPARTGAATSRALVPDSGRRHAQAAGARRSRRSWNARICSSDPRSTARRSTCGGTRSARGAKHRTPRPRRDRPVAHLLRDLGGVAMTAMVAPVAATTSSQRLGRAHPQPRHGRARPPAGPRRPGRRRRSPGSANPE